MTRFLDSNIFITRGDTAPIVLTVLDHDGKIYELKEGDKAVFSLYNDDNKLPNNPPILQKEFYDHAIILNGDDTLYLSTKKDGYLYTIEVLIGSTQEVQTIRYGRLFILL